MIGNLTDRYKQAENISNEANMDEILIDKGVYLPYNIRNIQYEIYIEPPVELPGGLDADKTTEIGGFTYSWSRLPASVIRVGRYCSIAGEVVFGGAEHPTSRLSTSGFTYESEWMWGRFCQRYGRSNVIAPFARDLQSPPITIGNDVWIGLGAYIRGGVCLGDGCVVGARAVVTRDVPPYAIVVGNPGRIIRYRFDVGTIEALLALQWWDYAFPDFADADLTDVATAVQTIGALVAERRIQPYRPRLIRLSPA